MASRKTASWTACSIGFMFMASGIYAIFSGNPLNEKFGYILFSLGGIFWGLWISIMLGVQSTKDNADILIGVLKHRGIIPADSKMRVNEKLEVVDMVSNTFTYPYNIEKPYYKAAI